MYILFYSVCSGRGGGGGGDTQCGSLQIFSLLLVNYSEAIAMKLLSHLSVLQGVPKSFRLLNLNIFRSTKSTKVNEVFSETLYCYHLSLLPLNL